MKIKTSEATKMQLNWLVAKCELALRNWPNYTVLPNYSTNWLHGGPLIEKYGVTLDRFDEAPIQWQAQTWDDNCNCVADEVGPTPLIAIMRAIVYDTFGSEVEIPEELV